MLCGSAMDTRCLKKNAKAEKKNASAAATFNIATSSLTKKRISSLTRALFKNSFYLRACSGAGDTGRSSLELATSYSGSVPQLSTK